jgi:ribose-phosphate pyrophosphokinase
VFAGDAIAVLDDSAIRKIVVTDTIPHDRSLLPTKFEVLPAAPILADALKRISTNRSVSALSMKKCPLREKRRRCCMKSVCVTYARATAGR